MEALMSGRCRSEVATSIRLVSLSKSYSRNGLEIPVVRGIDLEVPRGEFLALMGPSGSGKSTILNLIAGIDRPTSGEIFVGGEDLARLREDDLAAWRSRNIGFVFQLYHLIPVLTAFENVELPLLLFPLSCRERRRHAAAALDLVGLSDRSAHYPRQLSGGQEQRVAIARALVTDPAILLADEPTGDLDAASGEEILDLLTRLHRKFRKTVLLVTHDRRAAEHADRILVLDKGVLKPQSPERR